MATIVEPKKVRRLSEEHKAKLLEANQQFQFKNGSGASCRERQAPEKPKGDQESPNRDLSQFGPLNQSIA